MQRDAARTVAVSLLAVLVIGIAAGTLTTATTVTGPGIGETLPDAGATVEDDHIPEQLISSPTPTVGGVRLAVEPICIPALTTAKFFAIASLATVALFAGVTRRYNAYLAVAVLIVLALPGVIVYAALTNCWSSPEQGGGGGGLGVANATRPPVDIGGGAASQVSVASPSVGLLVLLGVVGLVLLGVVVRVSDGDAAETDATSAVEEPDEEAPAAIGRVAGDAADRIERTADVDNEVYRAWREMTTHLDVENPTASTPGEFAEAAVDAGMDAEDVAELTELFETVRYGGADPTSAREDRAVAALRRIEMVYEGDGA